ncbi:MAG: signal peptidase I [Planctomycetota bacterium]
MRQCNVEQGLIPKAGHRRRKRGVWLWLAAALVGCFLVRAFFLDVAEVRSPSMAPCLGSDPDGEPDCVLVLRAGLLQNHWSRYDLVTFPDPNSDPTQPAESVKRLAGLPGESVALREGDLYVDGKMEHKPHALFDRLLVPIAELRPDAAGGSGFLWIGSQGELGPTGLLLNAAAEPAVLRYNATVTDGYRDEHGQFHDGSSPPIAVNDLRFDVVLEPMDERAEVELVLRDEGSLFRAHLGSGGAHVFLDDREFQAPMSWNRGRACHVDFYNIDDQVGLWVDGRELLRQTPQVIRVAGEARNAPELAVLAGRVLVRRARISRDLYWIGSASLKLHADQFFVLGDNSSASIDSRQFGAVARGALRGRPVCIYSPFRRRRLL